MVVMSTRLLANAMTLLERSLIAKLMTYSYRLFLVPPFYAGLKDGKILDDQISASSSPDSPVHEPRDGRLDAFAADVGDGWAPNKGETAILALLKSFG